MFDLDETIEEWRRQMIIGGIKNPELLDELESHLREDVERQVRSGVDVQGAFVAAVRRIGRADTLRPEFEKTAAERKTMKRIVIIGSGIVGVLVGMAFVMPAVALYRHEGAISAGDVALLLLGAALTLGGAGAAVFGAKKRAA